MAVDPIGIFLGVGQRVTNNLKGTFGDLTPEKLIRLVIIVGAYMLLRPFLLKLASKKQLDHHDQENTTSTAKLSPNNLRGQVQIPDDSDDDDDDDTNPATGRPTGASWGKTARRRQRAVLKKLIDEHERKLGQEQEDKEDRDIEEFLIKD